MKEKISLKNKAIIVSIVILIIVVFILYNKFSIERNQSLLTSKVEESVEKLVELSTVKYNYTNILEYKDSIQVKGIDIPFTGKNFIVKYSGYLKAGVDLKTLEIDIIDKDTVDVYMEKPKILENVISEEDVYFFDEKNSIFNKLSFRDLYSVLIDEKEKMEVEALEKGFLNDAENNSEEIIERLLKGMGFKKIRVKFKDIWYKTLMIRLDMSG